MPIAGCEEGNKPIEYALESTENLEKEIEKKKNLTIRKVFNEITDIQNTIDIPSYNLGKKVIPKSSLPHRNFRNTDCCFRRRCKLENAANKLPCVAKRITNV